MIVDGQLYARHVDNMVLCVSVQPRVAVMMSVAVRMCVAVTTSVVVDVEMDAVVVHNRCDGDMYQVGNRSCMARRRRFHTHQCSMSCRANCHEAIQD